VNKSKESPEELPPLDVTQEDMNIGNCAADTAVDFASQKQIHAYIKNAVSELECRERQLKQCMAENKRLLSPSAAVPVEERTDWIEIEEGCILPEIEDLVLIITKEPEMRLATMGGHRDTFWEHLHPGNWDVRDVERWRHVEPAAPIPEEMTAEMPMRAILNHLRDEEADYLIGRCMPLLQILDENEQAVELLADIRKYAGLDHIEGKAK
jgi:hypothetical protein